MESFRGKIRGELNYQEISNTPYGDPGIYNKNIIFQSEATNADVFLLKDLEALHLKNDHQNTSLNIFFDNYENKEIENKKQRFLIFPYGSDEYKKEATSLSLCNNHSVITGPPGTGKSQFICNLIANLYSLNKTVLFVSHTNDAVDIVNEKLTQKFPKIIIRTGSQSFLNELQTQG